MTLNFPGDTSNPYIDPNSGLKYLYNQSIGAWETAIQPPAVISETKPQLALPGFFWWDSVGGSLYVYYNDGTSSQWVEAVPAGAAGSPAATVGTIQPTDPRVGDLWVDMTDPSAPLLYVYGVVNGTPQWILLNRTGSPFAGAYAGPDVSSGVTQPASPQLNDIWYDTVNKKFYIYTTEWEEVSRPAPPAPAPVNTQRIVESVLERVATTKDVGLLRLATQGEVNAGEVNNTVVSPGKLKRALPKILPVAGEDPGVVSLATKAEVISGTSETKAITPKALKESVSSLGVSLPAGTVIQFAGTTAPAGYLACDGSTVNRDDYPSLFSAIGTTYGGDAINTFILPNLTGDLLYCIKS